MANQKTLTSVICGADKQIYGSFWIQRLVLKVMDFSFEGQAVSLRATVKSKQLIHVYPPGRSVKLNAKGDQVMRDKKTRR